MDQLNADPEGNWHRMAQKKKKRLISRMYMDQSLKVGLDQREARSVKTERGVR